MKPPPPTRVPSGSGGDLRPKSKRRDPMKRISILFGCLLIAVGVLALAQDKPMAANTADSTASTDTMSKTVTGRVISSSAYALAVQTDDGTRLNLVLNSTTIKPAILKEGDRVTVVYRGLDAGGFEALTVTSVTDSGTATTATAAPLTNTGAPGTNGQTGESRSTAVGTTGSYYAPGNPPQPPNPDSTTTTGTMAETHPMTTTQDATAETTTTTPAPGTTSTLD